MQKLILAFAFVGVVSVSNVQAKEGFSNESELGLVLTSGNTDTQSISAKQGNQYGWSLNTLSFAGRYLRTKTNGMENARSWSLGLRYEREIAERWSLFLGQSVESDVFAGILQRYNTDVGAKYYIVKEENMTWLSEAGYRYSVENKSKTVQTTSNYGRLYTEADRAWNESFSTKLWVEYLYNFTVTQDYQFNTELSLSAMLTQIFSVKMAYLVKYDHVPNTGVVHNTDTVFTTALVAKF